MRQMIAVVALSLVAVVGCEDKKPAPTPTKPAAPSTPAPAAPKTGSTTPAIPGVSPDATKSITDMAAGAKQKVVDGYQKLLDETKTQVDAWQAKLGTAPADKKPTMQSALDGVTAKWTDASKKLADFKSSTSSDWQKLQGDVQTAFDNLQKQVSDAAAAFK